MTKKITLLVLSILLFAGLCACTNTNQSDTTKKITLCLDWTPNTNHTGFFVAQTKGYYKEAGIEVEIVQPPENGALLMCASNQAQFAIDAQDTMAGSLDSDTPLNVTAVAGLIQHNTSGIISRKGEGINTPKGLMGKRYSTWDLPVEQKMIQYIVEKDNGDFSQVTMIPNNIYDEAAALKTNQTDAIWIFYAWGGIATKQSGMEFDYFYFKDVEPVFDYYTPILVANNDFLKSDIDTAKAFLIATKKGYEYAIQNPEDAAQILIDSDTTNSLKDSDTLVTESQKYLAEQYIADAPYWGYIDDTRWNTFYTWLFENQLTTKNLTGAGYSNEYLTK